MLTWCHVGAIMAHMNLDPYVESIRSQLETAAQAGGEEARAVAERLVTPLEAAIRLALQDALAAAAEEITLELAPGSVEVRLRGREPEFVVSLPPAEPSVDEAPEEDDAALASEWRAKGPRDAAGGDEGAVSRINLRLPERLKSRVEQAADAEGLSINAWLVRAAASAVERRDPARRRERRAPKSAQRYSGWAR
jgi:HicB-like protein involved in pilus formation